MVVKISDIIKAMESLAPFHLAEEWDNVGLQVGQNDWPVKKVWIALDAAPDVVEAACSKDVDLIIAHHPLMNVWVDFGWGGTENGSEPRPYNTLAEGLAEVGHGGTIHIKPGTSSETPVITQRVTLVAEGGSVVIGQQPFTP